MLLPVIALAIAGLVAPPRQPGDSAVVSLRPHDPSSAGMTWVALDSSNRVLNEGTTPSMVKLPAHGPAVIYCVERGAGFLELEVHTAENRIRASGRCTKVSVRGMAVRTESMLDPRAPERRTP